MKNKLLIAYILLGAIFIALAGCKKETQRCQKCTIYTKLSGQSSYSTESSMNCQSNDLTGTETIVKSTSGQIIARKTWVCDAFSIN